MSLDTHFDGRYVTKPKIFSKQDIVIIFFPEKAEMLLFPNLKPRRLPGGLPKLYFGLKILHFFWKFWKISKFHIKIEFRAASWIPPWESDLKKATPQLSLERKNNFITFLDQFLPQFKTRHRKQSKNVDTCWRTRNKTKITNTLL